MILKILLGIAIFCAGAGFATAFIVTCIHRQKIHFSPILKPHRHKEYLRVWLLSFFIWPYFLAIFLFVKENYIRKDGS